MMTKRSLSVLTSMILGTPAPAAEAAPTPALPLGTPAPAAAAPEADEGDVVSAVDAIAAGKAAQTAGYQAGFAAANARVEKVLESPEGQAHGSTALFMLTNSDASADIIIGKLAKLPAPAAGAAAPAPAPAAAAPAAPAAQTPAERIAANTPIVDLGTGANANDQDGKGAGGGSADASIWDKVQAGDGAAVSIADAGIAGKGFTFGAAPKGMENVCHGG